MLCNLLLHSCKVTVDRIRGVGYIEFRIALIGKQVLEISKERQVCTPHTLVRIVPVLGAGNVRLLGYERMVPFLPRSECCGEYRFRRVWQSEHECAERFSCIGLRPPREVLRHRLHLVEVARLYRNVFEDRG